MSSIPGDAENILSSLLTAEVKKQGVHSKDELSRESLNKVYQTAQEKLDHHIEQLEGLLMTIGQNPIVHEFFHARQKLADLSKKSQQPTAEEVETDIDSLQNHIDELKKDKKVQQFIEKEEILQKAKKLRDEIEA